MPHQIDIPTDELVTAYLAGATTLTLARRYGCTPPTIAKRLRAAGIALRDARFSAIPIAEATLRRLYTEERLPIAAIAAALGVSAGTIGNRRRTYGIPIRLRHGAPIAEETAQAAPAERKAARRSLRETRPRYVYA